MSALLATRYNVDVWGLKDAVKHLDSGVSGVPEGYDFWYEDFKSNDIVKYSYEFNSKREIDEYMNMSYGYCMIEKVECVREYDVERLYDENFKSLRDERCVLFEIDILSGEFGKEDTLTFVSLAALEKCVRSNWNRYSFGFVRVRYVVKSYMMKEV